MKAKQAVDILDPQKWASKDVAERLRLLYQIRENFKQHINEANTIVAKKRNQLLGFDINTPDYVSITSAVGPASHLAGLIDFYEHLQSTGSLRQPTSCRKVADGLYELDVYPSTFKERVLYSSSIMKLRVKSDKEPVAKNPLDKPAGITAVLAAGNVASSLEVFKSLFTENRVVVHKVHPINVESDRVWEKILAPLYECSAISTCDADDGPDLCADGRLAAIWFTGSDQVAAQIERSASAPLASECGGVNPVIIVPGDRPWTEPELVHQAIQIATSSKYLGGSLCARPQVLVTSKAWAQREQFLDCMTKAIRDMTPAAASWYPGTKSKFDAFLSEYPKAEIIEPENGKYGPASRMLFIPGDAPGSYACKNEAFCQVLAECPLETKGTASDFLPIAIKFCNKQLFGSLSATILIDGKTQKANQGVVDKALNDLKKGSISVNGFAGVAWTVPHLTWGGCEEESDTIESGKGNFGNIFGFDNVEKCIILDSFVSPGHLLMKNKYCFDKTLAGLVSINLNPSWWNITFFIMRSIYYRFKSKDF